MTRTVREQIILGLFFTSMIFIHTGCSCNKIEKQEESKPPVESRPEVEKIETEKSGTGSADAESSASEKPGSGAVSKSKETGDKPDSQSAEKGSEKAQDDAVGNGVQLPTTSNQGQGTQPNATGNQPGGIGSPGKSSSDSGNSAGAGNSSETIGGAGLSGVPNGGQSSGTGSVAGKSRNPSQNGPTNETYTKAGRLRKK